MYPAVHAEPKGDRAAFSWKSVETVTYAELEARTSRRTHFLRNRGPKIADAASCDDGARIAVRPELAAKRLEILSTEFSGCQ